MNEVATVTRLFSDVKICAFTAISAAIDSPKHDFSFLNLTTEQRGILSNFPRVHGVHLLVSTVPVVWPPPESRRVIVVCDTSRQNFNGQKWFKHARPMYIAAFADGSSDSITPAEFAALPFTSFVDLATLTQHPL
jgi:hypothetical protein